VGELRRQRENLVGALAFQIVGPGLKSRIASGRSNCLGTHSVRKATRNETNFKGRKINRQTASPHDPNQKLKSIDSLLIREVGSSCQIDMLADPILDRPTDNCLIKLGRLARSIGRGLCFP
jgi:hypothetical protein